MSKTQAEKTVRQYIEALKRNNFPFTSVILYGSHAKNCAHEWSDIDVCVVSDRFNEQDDFDHSIKLWDIVEEVDWRIEPYGMSEEDLYSYSPLAEEIRNTGIRFA